METMKKFKIYFFIFIGFFALSTVLTNFLMRDNYENINYEIKAKILQVQVTECMAANLNGYIKGSITNDTSELIPLKYIQVNLYDENDAYLGSEYKELKNFYPKETINFDIAYEYFDINKVVINLVDAIPEKESNNFFGGLDNEELKIAAPIAGLLLLFVIIP